MRKPKPLAEVRLKICLDETVLELYLGGEAVDGELFLGKMRKSVAKEVAQVIFDDAFDLVNYTINGSDE